jgi:DUF1680 family protein
MLRAAFHVLSLALVIPTALAQTNPPAQPPQPPQTGHEGHDHPAPVAPKPVLNQKHLTPIPFNQVKLRASMWTDRFEMNRTVSIPAVLDQCESTGRIKNFAIASGAEKGERKGKPYDDSDVYKAIEAIAYTLAQKKDLALEARADAIIEKIAAAQQKDGYLNTFYVDPAKRWTNIKDGHELYCAGHLFEAATAYATSTGKTKLLDVAKKLADHIDATFGPKKKLDPCGHPEIELALVKLSNATGEKRYATLAKFFVDQRGKLEGRTSFGEYAQDHKPLREQTEFVGHAVRATYLYSGAADVANATGDDTLIPPLEKIWRDVVDKKMYITGGIGSSAANEGAGKAFDLPNDGAYCETCAAIGMALWSHRMLLATGEAKYADIVERELYNAILSGVSVKGDKFFYDNPIASRGDKERKPWFETACCPTNLVRFLPSVSGLVFATSGKTLYVLQYIPCEADVTIADTKVHIRLDSTWPDKGNVNFKVDPEKNLDFAIRLRRPAWCKQVYYQHDLKEQEHASEFPGTEAGWELYERPYTTNDGGAAHFISPVRREHAAPEVTGNAGRVAICRGALVYAVEGIDNQGRARSLVLPADAGLPSVKDKADTVIGSFRSLIAKGLYVERGIDGKPAWKPCSMTLLPYWLCANRGPTEMTVWIAEKPEVAELPGEGPVVESGGVRISASHCSARDTLAALNDKALPKGRNDDTVVPRMSFWDHRGSKEWVQYEYPSAKQLSSSRVWWLDDAASGGSFRTPYDWTLLWRDGNEWKPVVLKGDGKYGSAADAWNAVEFEPVTTTALRLEVNARKDVSAGIYEWEAQ